MAPRWHLQSTDKFLEDIPGELPTSDQRCGFYSPENLNNITSEERSYPELSKVANSVFEAAGRDEYRFLITCDYPPNVGVRSASDTFNDGGIYLNDEAAREATKLTDTEYKKDWLAEELSRTHNYGRTCFHHVAVPLEVKWNYDRSAFIFPSPPKRKARHDADELEPADTADGQDSVAGEDSQHTADTVKAEDQEVPDEAQNVGSGVDESRIEGGPFMYLHNSKGGLKGQAQLDEYMFKTFKHQHRIFCFAIYVFRDMCRLLRYDHSGAIVSEHFRWTSRDSALHVFLWKIAHLNRDGLGYDPTAVPLAASDPERERFVAMAKAPSLPEEVRTYIDQATKNSTPVYKVTVITAPPTQDEGLPAGIPIPVSVTSDKSPPDALASNAPTADADPHTCEPPHYQTYTFLIGDPLFAAEALVGRCTKGYVAYRLDDGVTDDNARLCFLKDCWRRYVPWRTRPEHLVHQHLHSHSVEHIASLICGGDVGGPCAQQTTIQNLLSDEVHLRPAPHVHYRLVTQEVGVPLTAFKDFQELAMVFAAALKAHSQAWDKAHLLHRDISVGNIMIDSRTRKGFLIDWDLSRFKLELGKGPVKPDRSGTWQYRSALLLQFPRKPCRLSDDIESYVHAFRLLISRFCEIDITLSGHVTATYEQFFLRHGVLMGGKDKLSQFRRAESPFRVTCGGHLQTLLDDLAKGCHSFYNKVNLSRMQAIYGIECVVGTTTRVPRTEPILLDEFDDYLRENQDIKLVDSTPAAHHSTPNSDNDDNDDPSEITGYLSSHSGLLQDIVRFAWKSRTESLPRGPDYFVKSLFD